MDSIRRVLTFSSPVPAAVIAWISVCEAISAVDTKTLEVPNGMLATPGIAYVTYHFEVAIGTQFALNQASVRGTHAAVVGLLDIFYDSIFPKVGNWTINRGFGG